MSNQRILIAIGTRGLKNRLTIGKQYVTLYGIEGGVLEYKPYVTVIDDNGKKLSCHYDRFIDITDKKDKEWILVYQYIG